VGISYDQSSLWQKLAGVPEEIFEREVQDETHMPTTTGLIRHRSPLPPMPRASARCATRRGSSPAFSSCRLACRRALVVAYRHDAIGNEIEFSTLPGYPVSGSAGSIWIGTSFSAVQRTGRCAVARAPRPVRLHRRATRLEWPKDSAHRWMFFGAQVTRDGRFDSAS
jgi:hypothetical protein